MYRLFFVLSLCAVINHSFAQDSTTYSNKDWYFYFEALGNGGHYSVNTEIHIDKGKYQSGDRFGLSYFIRDNPGMRINSKYLAILYEKNFIFGHKLIQPEIGIGGTFFFFNSDHTYFFHNLENDYYQLNGSKYLFWLIPRVGIRIVNSENFFFRLGYLPTIFTTEMDEESSTHFDNRFGVSFGFTLTKN